MLWPGMHLLIVACAHYHGWTPGCGPQNGFSRSTEQLDINFAAMLSVLLVKGMLFPVMVMAEVGEQAIFDGRVLHQGAPALLAGQSMLTEDVQLNAMRSRLRAMRSHMYVIPANANRDDYAAMDRVSPASFPVGLMAPGFHSQHLARVIADISRLAWKSR